MLIYNIIFFFLILNLKLRNIYLRYLIITSLIILPAIRDKSIGIDTKQYITIFEYLKEYDLKIEVGYKYLNKIVILFHQNEIFLFLLIGIIVFFFLDKFIKYFSLNYELTLIIYYTFYYFNYNFNILRHSIAFSIFCYSLIFLDKNSKKFFMWIFIASLFHYVAITAFPLYFLKRIKFSLKSQIIYILVSIFISVYINDILKLLSLLFPYINKRIIDHAIYNSSFSLTNFLSRLYIYVFCLWFLYNLKNKKIEIIEIAYIYGFYLMIILLKIGSLGIRLSLFYKGMDIIIWTYLLYIKKPYNRFQKIILLVLILYYLISVYKNGHIVPYILNSKLY